VSGHVRSCPTRAAPAVQRATVRQIITFGTVDSEAAARPGIATNTPVAMIRRIFRDPTGVVFFSAITSIPVIL